MLKCNLNNTPFLVHLLELKRFHWPWKPSALYGPHLSWPRGTVEGARMSAMAAWAGVEYSIQMRGPWAEDNGPKQLQDLCGQARPIWGELLPLEQFWALWSYYTDSMLSL